MRIVDYESNRSLNDVGLILSHDEIQDLCAYLQRLSDTPAVHRVHLSQYRDVVIERELTVVRDLPEDSLPRSA